MHVLTVYAHPNPKSFCHTVLEQFNEGLRALIRQTTITRGVRPREERDRLQHRGARRGSQRCPDPREATLAVKRSEHAAISASLFGGRESRHAW